MERFERASHDRIPQAGEPSELRCRQLEQVPPYGLHEHQFGEPGQHVLGAWSATSGLAHCNLEHSPERPRRVNGALVDETLEVNHLEALVYEVNNGAARLVGVEYIAPVAAWDASHEGPPVLMGQHFHLLGTPNRYRLPALYELHVWAWRTNPNGTFADWNPHVSAPSERGDRILG